MRHSTKQLIFFVDDKPSLCKAVSQTLARGGYKASSFTDAVECIKQLHFQRCDLLITDVRMPGMDGIELLAQVKHIAPWLPVLVITGYGDIPMAVKALKLGASDFIEKPVDRQTLLSTVELLLSKVTPPDTLRGKALTRVEMGVLRLILDGKSNSEIAFLRHRSVRTIEDERCRIMHKLGVDNVVDLVKRAVAMGLV